MEEGGLDALLMLLQSCQNITILRVASGAIANLARNGISECSLPVCLFYSKMCTWSANFLTVLVVKGYIFHRVSSDQINNATPPLYICIQID